MNKSFTQNIFNIYGDKGKQWLIDLPNIIEKISAEWKLSSLKTLGNLSMNYVASGSRGNKKIILKGPVRKCA